MDWDALAMLRMRRVSPARRKVAPNDPPAERFEDLERRPFKSVQIVPAAGAICRGFETKPPSPPRGEATQPDAAEMAIPIPGDLRVVGGVANLGRRDTAMDPFRQNLNGDQTAFRRSGSARRPGGWRK